MPIIDKEKRTARKEKREDIRTEKATKLAKSQALSRGEDWESIGKAPIVNPRIAETSSYIQEKADKAEEEGILKTPADIAGFESTYGKPVLEEAPQRTKEQLIQDARMQRKAKFGDILTAVGRGMQRKSTDPSMLKGNRLRQEQDKKFQEFKDISERNKRTQAAWDNQMRKDKISWLEKEISTAKGDKYKQDQLQLQLDKEIEATRRWDLEFAQGKKEFAQREARYAEDVAEEDKPTLSKTPYTDKFGDVAEGSRNILNKFAEIQGYETGPDGAAKAKDLETISRILMDKMYEVTEDEDGNKIFTLKDGMENFMSDLSAKMDESNSLDSQIQSLTDQKLQESSGLKGSKLEKVEDKYDTQINALEKQSKKTKTHIKDILQGRKNYIPTKKPTTQSASTLTEEQQAAQDAFFKSKK